MTEGLNTELTADCKVAGLQMADVYSLGRRPDATIMVAAATTASLLASFLIITF